ncbi:MAG: hypothetical protein M3Y71_02955 [Actinomycetota bacterium]|nr:hypothetical protein [Actinomycetota bacterium]
MSFRDLPPDWEHRSLADPVLAADVLDLVVGDADRRRGGVTVLITDEGRLAQPMFLELGHPVSPADREVATTRVAWLAAQVDVDAGVVVAVVRETGPFVTDDDRAWHETMLAACQAHDVPLLGMFLVTRHVVRPFPSSMAVRITA